MTGLVDGLLCVGCVWLAEGLCLDDKSGLVLEGAGGLGVGCVE